MAKITLNEASQHFRYESDNGSVNKFGFQYLKATEKADFAAGNLEAAKKLYMEWAARVEFVNAGGNPEDYVEEPATAPGV